MIDIREHGGFFGGAGSKIRKIQRGSVFNSANTSTPTLDISIEAVDISKSLIRVTHLMPSAFPNLYAIVGVLSKNNILSLQNAYGLLLPPGTITWEIVEFKGIKSLQSGILDIGNEAKVVNVDVVDAGKSMLFANYKISSGNQYGTNTQLNYEIINNTQIKFDNTNSQGSYRKLVHWTLINF